MTTHVTMSEEETSRVARDLASTLQAGAVVLLHGDLGAGKTAFVRGLAEGLGADPDVVSSPTFTLVQEYGGGRMPLVHADLYRVTAVEVDDLGLDEFGADAGVLAIEWAERLPRGLPGAISVHIDHGGGDRRTVCVREERTA